MLINNSTVNIFRRPQRTDSVQCRTRPEHSAITSPADNKRKLLSKCNKEGQPHTNRPLRALKTLSKKESDSN